MPSFATGTSFDALVQSQESCDSVYDSDKSLAELLQPMHSEAWADTLPEKPDGEAVRAGAPGDGSQGNHVVPREGFTTASSRFQPQKRQKGAETKGGSVTRGLVGSRADDADTWRRRDPLPPKRGHELSKPRTKREEAKHQPGDHFREKEKKSKSKATWKNDAKDKQEHSTPTETAKPSTVKKPTVMAPWAGKIQEQAALAAGKPALSVAQELAQKLDIGGQKQPYADGVDHGNEQPKSSKQEYVASRVVKNAWATPARDFVFASTTTGHEVAPQAVQAPETEASENEWQQIRKHRKAIPSDDTVPEEPPAKKGTAVSSLAPGVDVKKEARKSPIDQFGKVRCLCCGKAFPGYAPLEQHLTDKHFGLNSTEAKVLQSKMLAASGALQKPSERAMMLGDLVTMKSNSNFPALPSSKPAKVKSGASKDVSKSLGANKGTKSIDSTSYVGKITQETRGLTKQQQTALSTGTSVNVGFLSQYQKLDMKTKAEQRKETLMQTLHPEKVRPVNTNHATSDSNDIVKHKGGFARETAKKKKLTTLKKIILKDREKKDAGEEVEQNDFALSPSDKAGEPNEEVEEAEDSSSMQTSIAEDTNQNFDNRHGITESSDKEAEADHESNSQAIKSIDSCYEEPEEAIEAAPEANETDTKKAELQVTYIGKDVNIRYCDQVLSSELNKQVYSLLSDLLGFQQRAYLKDPVKAAMRRRLVFGLREVARGVRSKKAKCVVVAPNIEESASEGGLDGMIGTIITDARKNDIPVVFALTRNKIGKALGKRVRMSAVAIYSADGAEMEFKKMLKEAAQGRVEFQKSLVTES